MVSKKWEESVEESGLSRGQNCWHGPENWKASWRPEETFCHTDSHELPPADAGIKKNSQGTKKNDGIWMRQ